MRGVLYCKLVKVHSLMLLAFLFGWLVYVPLAFSFIYSLYTIGFGLF